MEVSILSNHIEERDSLRAALDERGIMVTTVGVIEDCSINLFIGGRRYIAIVDADIDCDPLMDFLLDSDDVVTIFHDLESRQASSRSERAWFNDLAKKIEGILSKNGVVLDAAPIDKECITDAAVEPTPAEISHKSPQESSSKNTIVSYWGVGASTGGINEVRDFFKRIGNSADGCFFVAQHIGSKFLDLLTNQIREVTDMKVKVAESGDIVAKGRVFILPIDKDFCIEDGCVALKDKVKISNFSPSIDALFELLASAYKESAGCVVFSGMGGDADVGAVSIKEGGGVVLAQSGDSAPLSFMPDNVRKRGVVDFSGTPFELAEYVIGRCEDTSIKLTG